MDFARMVATPAGRILRVLLGIVIIWVGVVSPKPFGYVLELVGLVPIFAGLLNWCFVCALIGAPLKASDLDRPHSDR